MIDLSSFPGYAYANSTTMFNIHFIQTKIANYSFIPEIHKEMSFIQQMGFIYQSSKKSESINHFKTVRKAFNLYVCTLSSAMDCQATIPHK